MNNSLDARPPIPGLRFAKLPTSYPARVPTHTQIEQLAYSQYLQRGKKPGHDVDDWLAAENRLRSLLAVE